MKTLFAIIVVTCGPLLGRSQTRESTIRADSLVLSCNLANGKELSIINKVVSRLKRTSRYMILLDGVVCDSLETFSEQPTIYRGSVTDYYFLDREGDESVVRKISGVSGRISEVMRTQTTYFSMVRDRYLIGVDKNSYEPVELPENFGNVSGGMKRDSELLRTIVIYDLKSNSKEVLFRLDSLALRKKEDIIEIFTSPDDNKILFTSGLYESGDQDVENVYEVDLRTRSAKKRQTPAILTKYDQKYARYNSWRLNSFGGTDSSREHVFIGDYIFDQELKVVGICLSKTDPPINSVFRRENNSINTFSQIDREKYGSPIRVLVPYSLEVEVELLLYQIYNGTILEPKSLSRLSSKKLLILKNMIFAKHNFRFDSEYYQAIFNLYRFYTNMDKTKRTKDVNHLLTDADKKNLELIQNALKRAK